MRPFRRTPSERRLAGRGQLIVSSILHGVAILGTPLPASSQYMYDPSAPDEQTPGIRYFGSARDERGVLISGVTVLINVKGRSDFVFITDEQGRFRGRLPLSLVGLASNAVTSTCSKSGYQFVRATKRDGMTAPAPYVQVDCVLHLRISK